MLICVDLRILRGATASTHLGTIISNHDNGTVTTYLNHRTHEKRGTWQRLLCRGVVIREGGGTAFPHCFHSMLFLTSIFSSTSLLIIRIDITHELVKVY